MMKKYWKPTIEIAVFGDDVLVTSSWKQPELNENEDSWNDIYKG